MWKSKILVLLGLVTLLASPALAGYVAGGTFVVQTSRGTILDNGGVVCQGTTGNGVGGGCLDFPTDARREAFVSVWDNNAGPHVAFQVCIDNNGDGICGGPQLDDLCRDQIFFSHDDAGNFFNPLGPLPTTFLPGCFTKGGHKGYVVLLCQGAHEVEGGTHTHALTAGSIGFASAGSGYGNFCGGGGEAGASGDNPAIAKAYVVE